MKQSLKILNTVLLAVIAVALVTIAVVLLLPDADSRGDDLPVVVGTLDTPYGELTYPSDWEDFLVIEDSDIDGVLTKRFFFVVGDTKAELFNVSFGDAAGDLLGYLHQNGVDVPVYVQMADVEPHASWTTEETEIYYCMLDDMNVLVEAITSREDFISE